MRNHYLCQYFNTNQPMSVHLCPHGSNIAPRPGWEGWGGYQCPATGNPYIYRDIHIYISNSKFAQEVYGGLGGLGGLELSALPGPAARSKPLYRRTIHSKSLLEHALSHCALKMTARACFWATWALEMTARACFEATWTLKMTVRACFGAAWAFEITARACFELTWALE